MTKTIKQLLSLYVASFLLYAGNGLFITSIGAKLYDMHVNKILIGVVNSSYFVGIVLGSIYCAAILKKVGHIRSFCFFGALYALGVLAHVLTDNVYMWLAFRIVLGFGTSGLLTVLESWLNEKSDVTNRSRIISYYSVTFYLSYLVSVFLLSFNLSLTNIFILSAIFTLFSLIPVSLTKVKEPQITNTNNKKFPNLFQIVPLALLGSFLSGLMVNGFFTMGSVYILELGFGAKEVSIFLACAIAGGFIIQIPIGKFSDTFGRKKAIIVSSCIAFMASSLLMVFANNILFQYIGSLFLGVGIFTLYSLSLARANDVADESTDIVEINRGLLLSYGTGSLISPILSSILLQLFLSSGFISMFIVSSIILAVFAITRDGVPLEDRSVYVPIVGDTSTIVSQMDIREENNSQEIEELQNRKEE